MKERYDDILNLPHPVSARHPRMPVSSRAAQFSPFAALTGYDAAIRETARLTDRKTELDDSAKAILDLKQQVLTNALPAKPQVTVTYFVADERKSGGAYVSAAGRLKKIDPVARRLVLTDGTVIPLDDVLELESELFQHIL